jgi:hypothetical protein
LAYNEDCAERYDALLAAAGFGYEDDYSQALWSGGERSIYEVRDAFPRLAPTVLPVGVSGVKYFVSLPECGAFLVSPSALSAALTEGDNEH